MIISKKAYCPCCKSGNLLKTGKGNAYCSNCNINIPKKDLILKDL